MNIICLKKSSKRLSTSQAVLVTDIADITAAAGADIIAATAAARAKEDTTTVMAGVIVTNAGATAAVNPKKVLVPLLGQGFFYVTD
ncbi:hypothetical protein P4472_03820 [Bacillus subtilis]|nr:hypothetical protein [Bacillus subtilis]MEC0313568.1 hypothetical protein [Bacillus subtilis]MEC0360651.1 hypothetical protein [Bacillus subtilis]MED3601134.1 hypothetical protein [Bacillus subtilis]MED3694104.1 hypothetical protein [Bacillus subtilis]